MQSTQQKAKWEAGDLKLLPWEALPTFASKYTPLPPLRKATGASRPLPYFETKVSRPKKQKRKYVWRIPAGIRNPGHRFQKGHKLSKPKRSAIQASVQPEMKLQNMDTQEVHLLATTASCETTSNDVGTSPPSDATNPPVSGHSTERRRSLRLLNNQPHQKVHQSSILEYLSASNSGGKGRHEHEQNNPDHEAQDQVSEDDLDHGDDTISIEDFDTQDSESDMDYEDDATDSSEDDLEISFYHSRQGDGECSVKSSNNRNDGHESYGAKKRKAPAADMSSRLSQVNLEEDSSSGGISGGGSTGVDGKSGRTLSRTPKKTRLQ